LAISICLSIKANAQPGLTAMEDSLIIFQRQLYSGIPDKEKLAVNARLKATFERALKTDHSFEYPFDSLKEFGRIYSPDKSCRIISWDLARTDGTHNYFGFIQTFDPKQKSYRLFSLGDKSSEIKNAENYTGDAGKWFGMLYYKIIPVQVKRKKYYTLLGFNANDRLTSKKIIDILYFAADGSPKFGADLFRLEKKSPKRMIFEYSAQVAMSLKYNESSKMIILDHLSPPEPRLEGQFQYYGPDFSLDGFEFKKGKWNYIPEIDARNKKNSRDNLYKDPMDKSTNHDPRKLYKPEN
jgi:hypothetical protein